MILPWYFIGKIVNEEASPCNVCWQETAFFVIITSHEQMKCCGTCKTAFEMQCSKNDGVDVARLCELFPALSAMVDDTPVKNQLLM